MRAWHLDIGSEGPFRRRRRGFTLVEVLVALLLLALLVMVFWRFFMTTTRLQVHQTEYLESMSEVLRVWHTLQDDLLTVCSSPEPKPVILEQETLDALGLRISKTDFPLRPRGVDFLVILPEWPPGRARSRPDAYLYPGVFTDHFVRRYEKLWKKIYEPRSNSFVWVYNRWPSWLETIDDDLQPHPFLDMGPRCSFIRVFEDVAEEVDLPPMWSDKEGSKPVVLCLRRLEGVTVYCFINYDHKGRHVRRLTRYSPEDGATVLSEGQMTHFDVRRVVELVPHAGDRDRPCRLYKMFFHVRIEACAAPTGRVLRPKPFAISTRIFPPYVNQPLYARWLPARK